MTAQAQHKLTWSLGRLSAIFQASIAEMKGGEYYILFKEGHKHIAKTVDISIVDDCFPVENYITPIPNLGGTGRTCILIRRRAIKMRRSQGRADARSPLSRHEAGQASFSVMPRAKEDRIQFATNARGACVTASAPRTVTIDVSARHMLNPVRLFSRIT